MDHISAEIAVIGSGPGGAVTACTLTEAGRDVVLLEEGVDFSDRFVPAYSPQEMNLKYRNGGLTVALGNPKIAYVEGRCYGGGSEVNAGLYHRTPADVLESWKTQFLVDGCAEIDLIPHFDSCEKSVSVSFMPGPAPKASEILKLGAERLSWKVMEAPRWFKYDGSTNSSGGAQGVRQSMSRTYLPRAKQSGLRVMCETKAMKLRREGSCWKIECMSNNGAKKIVEAQTVFVCAGATQSPALLRRSGITKNIGNRFLMHPTAKVVARFPEKINSADMGIPVHQVKEFAPEISIGGSISNPSYLALGLLDHPDEMKRVSSDWPHYAIYYVAVKGYGKGGVKPIPFFRDPYVSYKLTQDEFENLILGLRKLSLLLLKAGAEEIFPVYRGARSIKTVTDIDESIGTARSNLNLMTIHLFSSCPMGENKELSAVNSFGKVHDFNNLYVSDASILCTALGVNPQGTVMALARRNALKFLNKI